MVFEGSPVVAGYTSCDLGYEYASIVKFDGAANGKFWANNSCGSG